MDNKLINLNNIKVFNEYFYVVNYPTVEEDLCKMEMKYIFNKIPEKKYLFSKKDINPSRSPFIKHKISVMYSGDSLEYIVNKIVEDKVSFENFKVCYIKSEDGDVEYGERLKSVHSIGYVITGYPDMYNPSITLAVTKVKDKWIFGVYDKNDYKWHIHNDKPYSYSNALSIKVARSLVNIAVENNTYCTLIDPCCGVGTVVIEALDLGINVKGYELSKPIACNARNNLEFFGYERDIILSGDMHTIDTTYDVAIIDIPYGLYSPTTLKEQTDIIQTARKITDKLVIVTLDNMDNILTESGFTIIDKCCVSKNKFNRFITICN